MSNSVSNHSSALQGYAISHPLQGGKEDGGISWFNSRTVFSYDPVSWPDSELENDFRKLGLYWNAQVNRVRTSTDRKRKMGKWKRRGGKSYS